MKFRIIAAACAAFSIAAPAYAAAAPNFAGEIPNIPGKSLIANEVTYAPGEASPPTRTGRRLSFTPMWYRARSSRR